MLAYLDPGTGSFLLQMLVAGLVGGLYYLKLSWHKVRSLFVRSTPAPQDPPAALDEPPAP